jgi:hypothetical protein
LKDLFGKAKKKILNDEEEAIAALGAANKIQVVKVRPENVHPVSGIRTDVFPGWSPPGVKQSHFAEFKSEFCHNLTRAIPVSYTQDLNVVMCYLYGIED